MSKIPSLHLSQIMFIWFPNMQRYPHPPKHSGHGKLHTTNPFGLHPVGLSSCLAQRQTEELRLRSARSTAFVCLGKEKKKIYLFLEKEKVILKTVFSRGECAPGNQGTPVLFLHNMREFNLRPLSTSHPPGYTLSWWLGN